MDDEGKFQDLYDDAPYSSKSIGYGGEKCKERENFILHDGPPYAYGHIHMGTALNKILKDVIVRTQQMAGKNSKYVTGWD